LQAIAHFESPENAEDILQNFFLSLILKPLPPETKDIRSYLYRSLINDIKDFNRREKTHRQKIRNYRDYLIQKSNFGIVVDAPDLGLTRKEQANRIFTIANTRLAPHMRITFNLRYKLGYRIGQISKTTGVKKNVIRVYLTSARKMIRYWIGERESK
jgi:RNA polymerase sigma factor (sigma-70 family)